MHSCAFWIMFLEVETDEKILKTRTIDGAFWRYKKNIISDVGTPLSWEHFEIKDMVHSDPIWNDILEVGTAEKNLKSRQCMVHSEAIWNDVLEVGTAEKARSQNGTFWHCLKRRKLEQLRTFWKQGEQGTRWKWGMLPKRVLSIKGRTIWNSVLEVVTA